MRLLFFKILENIENFKIWKHKYFLIFFILLAFIPLGRAHAYPFESDLLHYYPLKNNASDSWSNLDFTVNGAPQFTGTSTFFGVNNTSSYLSMNNLIRNSGYPTSSWAIGFWYSRATGPNDAQMIFNDRNFNAEGLQVYQNLPSNEFISQRLRIGSGADGITLGLSTLNHDDYYLYEWDNSAGYFNEFINGSPVGTSTSVGLGSSGVSTTTALMYRYSDGYYGSGSIHDLAGWKRNFTADEVQQIYDYYLTPPAPDPSISLLWPQNNTSTPNFSNWYVKFNVATTTSYYYQVNVFYGVNSSSLIYSDQWPRPLSSYPEGLGISGNLDLNIFVKKSIAFYSGETFCAKAALQRNNTNVSPVDSTVIAQSSISCFNVVSGAIIPGGDVAPSSTVPDQQSIVQKILEGVIPAYEENIGSTSTISGLCGTQSATTTYTERLFAGLICPTGAATDFVSNQFKSFQQTFPFSILYNVINDIKLVTTSSTSDYSLILPNTFTGNITILTSSTLVQYFGQGGKDMIFNLEAAIIWLILSFETMFIIFRHFK